MDDLQWRKLVECPVCGKAIEAKTVQVNMVSHTPSNGMIPPSSSDGAVPPTTLIETVQPPRGKVMSSQQKCGELSITTRLWLLLCSQIRGCFSFSGFVLFFAFFCAVMGYLSFSNSMSPDEIAKKARETDLPEFFQNKEFVYYGGVVKDLKLSISEKKLYTGEVTFTLDGKTLVRPISVRIKEDGEYEYGVDFDYAQHDDYLEEDAKWIMNNILRANNLSAKILKTYVVSPGVFQATLRFDEGVKVVRVRVQRKSRKYFYEVIE
ncbi:MAG: hypothetical protein IKP00_04175 [Victivallales bacterium]|nr:hypothetical protein [Victivallales bacterium]